MKLKLMSADKAETFGLEAKDQTEAHALARLREQGFVLEGTAEAHLEQAIQSGAFARVGDDVIIAQQFRNTEGKFVSADQQDADGKAEPIVRHKRTKKEQDD